MLEPVHRRALLLVLEKLKGFPHPWVVTGSCGMALQGMPLKVHDIDLQTTASGALAMEQTLGGQPLSKMTYKSLEKIRSLLGALELENVKIEIIGDMQKLLPDGSWEQPVDISAHRIWVCFENQQVPVFSLQYEMGAYRLMGRIQRAAQIQEWLNRSSTK